MKVRDTALLVLAIVTAAAAPGPQADMHVDKAALAGQRIRVWSATQINPDCTAAGTMTTEVVEAPRHGVLVISEDPTYPNYPPFNPRSACNARQVPAKQAFYTSDASFKGRDEMILRNATSEGTVRRIIVGVDVQTGR